MNSQPDLFAFDAAQAAREGAKRAIVHADECSAGWSDAAYAALGAYALTHQRFTTEQARVFAHNVRGLPLPPTNRAWGSVVTRAVASRVIEHRGEYRNSRVPPAHAHPVKVWASLVCERPSL